MSKGQYFLMLNLAAAMIGGVDALNTVLFPEGGEWQPFMSVLTAVEVRILFFTETLLIFISFEISQAISITMKNGKEK